MPYDKLNELPKQVEDLPKHAKEIWMEAYNSAHEQYGEDKTAAKVAWSAVKNEYHKNKETGEWVADEDKDEDNE